MVLSLQFLIVPFVLLLSSSSKGFDSPIVYASAMSSPQKLSSSTTTTMTMTSRKTSTKYTLSYFPFKNRGEPIRLAFVLAGIPFTNKAIDFDEFKKLKPTLPTAQFPVLEIQEENQGQDPAGTTLCQSHAILRYLGKLTGLYPTDTDNNEPSLLLAARIDIILDVVTDIFTYLDFTLGPEFFYMDPSKSFTQQELTDIRTKLMDPNVMNNIYFYLKFLEEQLTKTYQLTNGQCNYFFNIENGTTTTCSTTVNGKLTIADLRVHQVVQWLTSEVLDGISKSTFLQNFPRLQSLHDSIESLPEVIDFRNKHGHWYSTFDYIPLEKE